MDKIKLTTKELRELKGGQDVTNTNWRQGCVCEYKNANRTYNNENIPIDCTCTCIVRPD